MPYPNSPFWSAMRDGLEIAIGDKLYVLSVINCGTLVAPHGQLVACDPFVYLDERQPFVPIPPGTYPAYVTLADVSGKKDGSHIREAYATLVLDPAPEVSRQIITPLQGGEVADPELIDESYHGFPVDAGTACFVDAGAIAQGMPSADVWHTELFDNDTPDSWFNRMDDPEHIRAGLANIRLPLAQDGANILIVHSGWGDGVYPVIGGYSEDGKLVRVHIDFLVIFVPESDNEA